MKKLILIFLLMVTVVYAVHDDPIHVYTFEGNYNTSNLTDQVGNGTSLNVSNIHNLVEGKDGNGWLFNSSNPSYVGLPEDIFHNYDEGCISMWLMMKQTTDQYNDLYHFGVTSELTKCMIEFDNDLYECMFNNGAIITTSGIEPYYNDWVHIVHSWASNEHELYVNGSLVASTYPVMGQQHSNGGTGLGFKKSHDIQFTNAIYDEMYLYNHSCDSNDVLELYTGWFYSTSQPDNISPSFLRYNVTSANVKADENTSSWEEDGEINISSDLLTLSIAADENSNLTCVLNNNWSYTYAELNNSNYKAATTVTTDHAYTVFDSISEGYHKLYCSLIDIWGNIRQSIGLRIRRIFKPFVTYIKAPHLVTTNNDTQNFNFSIHAEDLKSLTFEWNYTNYTIFNQSLKIFLNFDNRSIFNESKNSVMDIANLTGHTITDSNITAGIYGKGLNVDAVNDKIVIKRNYSLDSFSSCIWHKRDANMPDGSPTLRAIVNTHSSSYKTGLIYFGETNNVSYCRIQEGDGTSVIASSPAYSDSSWRHICCTGLRDNYIKLFINGKRMHTVSTSGALKGYEYIVLGQDESTRLYNGTLDDFMFFDRFLNDSEIEILYNVSLTRKNLTEWKLTFNKSNHKDGTYNYRTYVRDTNDNINYSDYRYYTIGEPPEAPICDGAVNASALGCTCGEGWYQRPDGMCEPRTSGVPGAAASFVDESDLVSETGEQIGRYPYQTYILIIVLVVLAGTVFKKKK